MERPPKGRQGPNRYNPSSQPRNGAPINRYPHNKFAMHGQQPYGPPFEVYTNPIRCTQIVTGVAPAPARFQCHYPMHYFNPIYSNSNPAAAVLGSSNVPLLPNPMTFATTMGPQGAPAPGGAPGGPPPPGSEMHLVPPNGAPAASGHHPQHVNVAAAGNNAGGNPGAPGNPSGAIKEPPTGPNVSTTNVLPPLPQTKRRSKAIEIIDPSSMKPIHIGEEGTSDSKKTAVSEPAPPPPVVVVVQKPSENTSSSTPNSSAMNSTTSSSNHKANTIAAPAPPAPSVVPQPSTNAVVIEAKEEEKVTAPSKTTIKEEYKKESSSEDKKNVNDKEIIKEETIDKVVVTEKETLNHPPPPTASVDKGDSSAATPTTSKEAVDDESNKKKVELASAPEEESTKKEVSSVDTAVVKAPLEKTGEKDVEKPTAEQHIVEKENNIQKLTQDEPKKHEDDKAAEIVVKPEEEEKSDEAPPKKESEETSPHKEEEEAAEAEETEKPPKEEEPPLKYDYKPDQWSPHNTSGKKQYDSAFLKQLQSNPLSLTKPSNLPELDIIKNVANDYSIIKGGSAGGSGGAAGGDFMPIFSGSSSSIVKSSSRNSISKRPSRDGRTGRPSNSNNSYNNMMMMSSSRSLSNSLPEKVELRTTDNPWRPSSTDKSNMAGDDSSSSADSMEVLGKKVRSILNKLTPQKFDDLLQSFNELTIDSETKLKFAIELIFEKAIDEPNYSVAYARMCEVLQAKSVEEVKFKTIIITKCQQEFEKAYMSPEEKQKYVDDMAAAKTEAEKKSVKEEFEMRELRARRRSLGNIRFIGEIFKRGLLSISIMHGCIHQLLSSRDEESLESLCRLLTTVGKKIEADTIMWLKGDKVDHRIRSLDKHFQFIQDIIDGRQIKQQAGGDKNSSSASSKPTPISNRIRFMLQDIVDLRKSGWIPRRDVAGPKTIDQIHQDIAREKKAQSLNSMNQSMSRHESSGSRGSSSRGGNSGGGMMSSMNNNNSSSGGKYRSSYRSGGGNFTNGGHSDDQRSGSGSNSWVGPKKPSETLDMEYMKNINNKMTNIDHMKFGPNSRSSWGKGSMSSRKSSATAAPTSEPPLRNTNRFSSFSGDISDRSLDSSSSSYTSISKTASLSRNGRSTTSDKDYSSRSGGDSSSHGGSGHHRVKDSRSMHGTGTSGGPAGGGSSLSSTPEPRYKLSGSSELPEDDLKAIVYEIFSAYVRNNNMEAALRSMCSKMSESNIKESIEALIDKELDSKAARRQHLGTLIQSLMKEDLLLISDVKDMISSFFNDATEYLSDIPRFWEYFVEIFACLFLPSKESSSFRKAEIVLPFSFALEFLPNSFESTPSSSDNQRKQQQGLAFVSALLTFLVGLIGQERTSELFHSSLSSSSSSSSSQSSSSKNNTSSAAALIDRLVSSSSNNEKQLSFLRELPSKESPEALKRTMESFFSSRSSNEAILKWVNESIGKDVSEGKVFIRTFVVECIRSTIKMPQSELITEDITERIPLLSSVLGSDSEKQLQALFAIQKLVMELTYPPGLLPNLFSKLSESDVIKDEVFLKWRDDGSASERDGKGVCVPTLTRFFEAIENS